MEEEYLNIGGIYSPRGMRGLTRQDYLDWETRNAQILQDNQIPKEQWEDYFVTSKMLKFFPEEDKTFWDGYTLDQQVQIYNSRVQELADAFNARPYVSDEDKVRDLSGLSITDQDLQTTRDREEVNIEDPDDLEYLAKVGQYGIFNSIFGQRNTYKSAENAEDFNGTGGKVSMVGLQNEYDRLLHKSYTAQEQEFMDQFKQSVESTEDPQKTKEQLRTEIQSVARRTSPYYRYYEKQALDAFADKIKKDSDLLNNPNDNLSKYESDVASQWNNRWQNTFTNQDWDEMAEQFAVDSKLHGQDYAVRHLNERIQDTVDDEISFFEKIEKGIIGGNVYQTAGALIQGVGLLAGIISDLNPENRDENLSVWQNLWYNVVNNKVTQYGNDVSQYGAFAPNKIDEWKEIGVGRYQITTQSSQDYGGFADQVFNENFVPTALGQVGFTNAAALESRLFSWAGKGIAKLLGKRALKNTVKRVAQASSAAQELSSAAKKGFLDAWDTWTVPALTSLMESQAEAVEVSKNVLTQGDQVLDTLKDKDFQEAFRNEYNTQFQRIKEYYMQQPYANNSNQGVYVRISQEDGSTRYEYLKPKEEWAEEQAANYLNQTENLQAITDNVRNQLDGKYKPYESEIKAEAAKAAWGTFYRNFGIQFVLNTTLEKAIQAPSVRARLDEKSPFRRFNAEGTPGNMKVTSRYTTGRQVWDIAKVELGESIEEYWQTINEEAGAAKGQYNIEKYIDNMYNGDQMMQIGDNAAGATKKFWQAAGETALSNQAFVAAAYGGFGAMLGTAKFNGYRTVMRNPDGSIATDDKGNPIMGFGRTYKEDGKRESIWDVMVRWFPWETGIGRDIRYTNLKKKGLQEEADRIRTFFNNPDNADKLKDDLAALKFAEEVAEEGRDQLDLTTSANGQYVAMWNYLNKIKGTSAYNQLKSKLDILSGEAAREEIGEAESERLINSYVEHMKKGEDREENQDKSVEQLKQQLRENAKTIKDKFDKVSEYSKFVNKNFGLIDDDVKKALVWGYMNIDDAKAQLDEVTGIINSTKHGTTDTQSTINEDLWEDYAKHTASKRGVERVEETLQKYIQKRDQAKQKLENVKEHSNRKSRNSIKEEIKAWDRVIEKQQKALNKLKSDIHYSQLDKIINEKQGVISAEDIMRLDPESRWLLINNAKEYSKEQQTEIKKLLKVNNPQAFKNHLQQAAQAYSAIRQITENITKATSDPDYYDRYVQQIKTEALRSTARNTIRKINEIPDYDNFVKALNETLELGKNKPEALYYQMELNSLANSKEGNENLKRYMEGQKKLSEFIDVLQKDPIVKMNSDLNERTILGLFQEFMTNEKKVNADEVTDKDVRDHFDEFRAYVEKWNSQQNEEDRVSFDNYSDPISSLQRAFAEASDAYQTVQKDKQVKQEQPQVDKNATLDQNGEKRGPIVEEIPQNRENAILVAEFYSKAIDFVKKGVNVVVQEEQGEKLQTLDNEQVKQLLDIIEESIKGAEDILGVEMNLLQFQNTTSDESVIEAIKSLINIADSTTSESIRHQVEPLSDTAISSIDMVTTLSVSTPSGSIDKWVQQTLNGVEDYLRDHSLNGQRIYYIVSPEVTQIDRKQTDKTKKLNEDTLPIMMCVRDDNGKYKDANGDKYQVIGFLPYGNSQTSKNIGVIQRIRKAAFEQYNNNKGITDGYPHPVLDENGNKLYSQFERLNVDMPSNGSFGDKTNKFALRDVLLKLSGSKSLNDKNFKDFVKKIVKSVTRITLGNGHYMLAYNSTAAGNRVYFFVKKVSRTVNRHNQNLADVINEAVENKLFGIDIIQNFNPLTHNMCDKLGELQGIYANTKTTLEQKDDEALLFLKKQMGYFVNLPDGWDFTIEKAGNVRVIALQSQDPQASYNGFIKLAQFNAQDPSTLGDETIKDFMTNLFAEQQDGQYVIRKATAQERPIDYANNQNDFIIWQINYTEAEMGTEQAARTMENYLENDLLEINQDFLDVQVHGVSVSSPFQSSEIPQIKEQGDTTEITPQEENEDALQKLQESTLQKLGMLRKGVTLVSDGSHYEDLSRKEYSRVTSEISDFNEGSPYTLPSTTIGNVYDTFVRDFFAGDLVFENGKIKSVSNIPLSYLYKNASEQELSALAQQLDTLKSQLLADGITILTPKMGADRRREQFTIAGSLVIGGQEKNIAGTMDLVGIDKYGKLHIFDMKTFHVQDVNNESEIKEAIQKREDKWKRQLTLYARLASQKVDGTQLLDVASVNIIPIAVTYPAPTQDNEYSVDPDGQLFYNSRPITNTTPKLIKSETVIGLNTTDRYYLKESQSTNEEIDDFVALQTQNKTKSCKDSDLQSNDLETPPDLFD